jgi:gliding motility-associated-like protein
LKEGNNIEKLFKDGFENYEIDPGDHLWSKIQSEIPTEGIADAALKSTGSAAKAGGSWLTTVVVGGAIGLVSVAGYYYFENQAETRKAQNESEQLIEQPTDQETQESNPVEAESNLAPASNRDLDSDENADLENRRDEISNSSATSKDSPVAKSNKTSNPSANKADDQLAAPQETATQSASKSNEDNSNELVEPKSTTQASGQQSGNSITEDPSGSNLENNSSNPIDAKIKDVSNQDTEVPEKNSNETKSGSDNNGTIVNPPSNSVDETPGVIEAYKPPNIFTPNGDGMHDIFQVDLEGIDFDEIEVRIFSRSGDEIHSWRDEFGFWDGKTRNGSNAPEGPYFYTLMIKKDGKIYTKRGSVTLSRGQ